MKGTASYELEVGLQAEKIWAVYRGLRLAELMVELLPNLIEKFDIVQGDGEVGTILCLYWSSGKF